MALLAVKRKEGSTSPLTRFHQEIDDLFSSFFEDWEMPLSGRSRWPAIDIAENENEFIVKAEVPGCKPDDIDISVHDSRLTISGEKKQEKEKQEKGYYHLERSYGSFRRDLNLGSNVDPGKIEADCKNGVPVPIFRNYVDARWGRPRRSRQKATWGDDRIIFRLLRLTQIVSFGQKQGFANLLSRKCYKKIKNLKNYLDLHYGTAKLLTSPCFPRLNLRGGKCYHSCYPTCSP